MDWKGINRRQMLTGAALLAGSSMNAQSTSTALDVAGPSEAKYSTLLQQHFPGAIDGLKLDPVQSMTVVLANPSSGKGIRAVALRWTITTTQGVHSEVIFHMMPGYMGKNGTASVGAGRRLLLPKGRAVLLTPATVVTSGQYGRGYRPNLNKNLQRTLRRQFYRALAATAPASAVTVTLEGVYYADGTLSGTAGSPLHQHVRLIQNAEHDQALSVIRVVREATTRKVPHKLAKRRLQRLSKKGTAIKREYQHERKQHARRLVRQLKKHGQAAMVQHLETLLKYPKVSAAPETQA